MARIYPPVAANGNKNATLAGARAGGVVSPVPAGSWRARQERQARQAGRKEEENEP